MASEPGVGEGNDGGREKQRFSEHKVYTRKFYKGVKKLRSEEKSTVETTVTTSVAVNNHKNDDVAAPVNPATATASTLNEKDKESSIEACPQTLVQEDGNSAPEPTIAGVDAPPEMVSNPEQPEVDVLTMESDPGQDSGNMVQSPKASQLAEPSALHQDSLSLVRSPNDMEVAVPSGRDLDAENTVKSPKPHDAASSRDHVTSGLEVASGNVSKSPTRLVVVQSSRDQDSRDMVESPNELQVTLPNATEPDSGNVGKSPKPPEPRLPDAMEQNSGERVVRDGSDSRLKINLTAQSRQEKIELRRKLESDLDLVRSLVKRIEAKEGEISGFDNSRVLVTDSVNNGGRVGLSEVTSVGIPREVVRQTRPLTQLRVSVLDNSQAGAEHVEKEKRTPKANQFYTNSQFLLAKDKFPPADSNKKTKGTSKKQGGELGHRFGPGSKVFKNCSALLERLMKHKHGWVFNTPVDVKGLGLHDYFTIIKHPMDLGTVKSRLTKNWYKAPREFAEDVRLTFNNAMTYNPKGQDVHIMAEQLSTIFEERWAVIEADYNREMRSAIYHEMTLPSPGSRKPPLMRPAPMTVRRTIDRAEWSTRPMDSHPKPLSTTPSGRTPALKKPKANEPNKRDMTYEEKQKLSVNLQSLPSEKLDQIVHIVKKRNSALSQRDDEIEVDIDSVDAETLWELDRFVTNYKKSLSKKKRKAELAIQARAEAEQNVQEKTAAPATVELPKENNTASGNIVSTSMPPQAEKQGDDGSRSSSSSSSSSDSSSSSSGSDSDSSSTSGSDSGHSRQT